MGLGLHLLALNAHRGLVFALNYHRIRPAGAGEDYPFDDGVFGPDAAEFKRQVAWLKTRLRMLSLDQYLELLAGNPPGPGPYGLITFDDGYVDNFELALPILKELEVPAVMFIPTGPITSRELGWWDLIAYLVKKCQKPWLAFMGQIFGLKEDRAPAIHQLQTWMKSLKAESTAGLLKALSEACEVPLPGPELQGAQLMTWDQVIECSQGPVAIGSHTHSHRVLSTLDRERQKQELCTSKAVLEEKLGREVKSVAYPVGGQGHYTPATQELARACGYSVGFTFGNQPLPARRINRFAAPRMAAPDDLANLRAAVYFPALMTYSSGPQEIYGAEEPEYQTT